MAPAPRKTFWRVALPLAAGGLVAGAAVAFARGLGEFGATIMFAGSLQGVTQTVSLAIYQEFDVNLDIALAISAAARRPRAARSSSPSRRSRCGPARARHLDSPSHAPRRP